MKNEGRSFRFPDTLWPIEWGKKNGLYFYLTPIKELGNGRVIVEHCGEKIMMGSYSYLGLLGHPKIEAAAKKAIDQFSTGTHGARLLTGTVTLHNRLEERIACFKNTEAAIVYSSGYVANLATISALVHRGDYVICDKSNHASILEGCMLSGARLMRFQHNNMEHLDQCLAKSGSQSNKLIVVDAVFSMDGSIINLPEVIRLSQKYGALLMVDEAHALGVIGQKGHGIEEHYGLPCDAIDVKMGTLSKAIPSMGGYIAGSHKLIEMLKHQASGFIFSGALAPSAVGASLATFDVIEEEPERVASLQHNMTYFSGHLSELGFDTLGSEAAIVPIICGDDKKAWTAARLCLDKGILVQGIPYPVVPKGTARLRCMVTATHSISDIDFCIDVLKSVGHTSGLIN